MIRQSLDAHRAPRRHRVSTPSFILALVLSMPYAALAAGPPGGSSSGGSGGGSSSSAQAPPIPLELKFFASCTRTSHDSLPVHPECVQTGNPTSSVPGSWTARENCELSLAYNQERWQEVRKIIKDFLDNLDCKPRKPPEDGYYSVVFFNEGLTTPALSRVIFHRYPKPEIYGNRVGSYDLYDLKLLPDFGIPVTSVYQASTAPNGVIAQLPGVIAKAAGTFANIPVAPLNTPGSRSFLEVTPSPSEETITPASFVIHRISSPKAFKRGGLATPSVVPQVSISDQISFSPALKNYFFSSLSQRAAQADARLQSHGEVTTVNKLLAESYKKCQGMTTPPPTCQLGVPQDLPPSLIGNQEFMQDVVDLSATYTAFYAFSNSGAQPSVQPLTTQYTFGKLTRWSFSLGAGGMFPAFHNKPAKVVTSDSSTSLASDLTSPSITFVAADFHPVRYDETRFSPTGAERFRVFGGIALTPKAGFVLGLGESLFRGFTLEGGFAALLSDVVPTSTKFGIPDPNAKTRRGFFYAPFLAVGYSFQ